MFKRDQKKQIEFALRYSGDLRPAVGVRLGEEIKKKVRHIKFQATHASNVVLFQRRG